MLIMKYNGGLGNQMFQFAAVSSLAMKLGVDFSFDMSFFNHSYSRPYEISIFQLNNRISNDTRTKLFWKIRKNYNGKKFLGLNIYRENSFSFEEKFNEIGDNTFIEGFFQSYKYIDEALIKKYFTFKIAPDEKNVKIIKSMHESNSVSLHIRRGDYVNKKRYQNLYNHLDIAHYEASMEYMAKSLDNPVFYVFSDDIKWAQENLNFNNCPICDDKGAKLEFISHNNDKPYEDMRLMSNCSHNIIANSSFSWWGAYLNKNSAKIVIAPKKWFLDTNKSTKDTYPESWITL